MKPGPGGFPPRPPLRFRPPWWAVLLAAIGCAAGIALGNWQSGRAGEKRALAASLVKVTLRGTDSKSVTPLAVVMTMSLLAREIVDTGTSSEICFSSESRWSSASEASVPACVAWMMVLFAAWNCDRRSLRRATDTEMSWSVWLRNVWMASVPLFSALTSWRAASTVFSARFSFDGVVAYDCSASCSLPISVEAELAFSTPLTWSVRLSMPVSSVDWAL